MQQCAEFLGEIEQDRTGFEQARRCVGTVIHQRRDLAVGIDVDKAAAELVAIPDVDQIGIIFRALVAERQQLLEHHRHLHAIGRGHRIELQRMLADRQFHILGRASNRPVDIGELAAIFLVPFPDFGRGIVGQICGHGVIPFFGSDDW